MTTLTFSDAHKQELSRLRKNGTLPHYVYRKIDALFYLTQDYSVSAIAGAIDTSRTCIYDWKRRFIEQGLSGLYVEKGKRGPKQQVDPKELEEYVRQSPENFGLMQTRWTLRALAQTVPSLKGMTDAGVHLALRRIGYRYKRAQPLQTSPDPEYAEKKRP